MTISIRNAATEAGIRLLAARTGRSLTEATDDAVQAELRRLDSQRGSETPEEKLARMRRFTASIQNRAAAGTGPWLSDDDLYDDDGAPR